MDDQRLGYYTENRYRRGGGAGKAETATIFAGNVICLSLRSDSDRLHSRGRGEMSGSVAGKEDGMRLRHWLAAGATGVSPIIYDDWS